MSVPLSTSTRRLASRMANARRRKDEPSYERAKIAYETSYAHDFLWHRLSNAPQMTPNEARILIDDLTNICVELGYLDGDQ